MFHKSEVSGSPNVRRITQKPISNILLGSSKPLVTVIVATKNEERQIERCLKSIRKQGYDNLELIVVDNFSTDDTVRLASSFADIVVRVGPERSSQRNRGIALARGRFVLIIDADMELSSSVVEECVSSLSPQSRAVVIPEQSVGSTVWARCKALEKLVYCGSASLEATRFFDIELLHTVGGYDESLFAWEDWDLSQRVDSLTRRARITAPIVHHEGDLSLWQTFSKKRYYGSMFLQYRVKHPAAAREQISISRILTILRYAPKYPGLVIATVVMKLVEGTALGIALLGYILRGPPRMNANKK